MSILEKAKEEYFKWYDSLDRNYIPTIKQLDKFYEILMEKMKEEISIKATKACLEKDSAWCDGTYDKALKELEKLEEYFGKKDKKVN